MPNNFVGHVDKWLLLSESETDFAALFVRAWIPFNAWYCNHYQNTQDRYCLDLIKTDGNQFRANLIGLLGNDNPEADDFRRNLAHLHSLLQRFPIPEADVNKRITLTNLWFRTNPQTSTNPPKRFRNLEYKVERLTNNTVNAIIVNTRSIPHITLYTYTHNSYNLVHFENDININISNPERSGIILSCFKEIDPKRKENLLSTDRRRVTKIGEYEFINDVNLLSQAIIELLYSVRNKLFHGELQPSRNNLSIYEPAYHLLRILLKSLR